jgi:hypothetical protein
MSAPDPLVVTCPHCGCEPRVRCLTRNSTPVPRPHLARVRLAYKLAAHADHSLDAWFKMRNQCGICAVPGLPQRHRRVDAIAGMLEAGECEQEVAADMGVSLDAVMAVTAWAAKWPGAWR